MMGAVFTEKEIRELLDTIERRVRLFKINGEPGKSAAYADTALLVRNLLEEHGL